MGGKLPRAVDGSVVKAIGAVRLSLKPDSDVLDWTGEKCIRYACECPCSKILSVGKDLDDYDGAYSVLRKHDVRSGKHQIVPRPD